MSVLDEIIRYKARTLAEAHIKRAVNEIVCGGQFNFEDCQREINNYWQRKSVNLAFENAYNGPWYTLGGEDAQVGLRRFEVPAYQKGWRNKILAFALNGWVNPRIMKQYGWIDEAISQQCINIKHQLDQLNWKSAPYDKNNRTELNKSTSLHLGIFFDFEHVTQNHTKHKKVRTGRASLHCKLSGLLSATFPLDSAFPYC